MATIRVLLADDHPLVRQGLRAMLSPEPDLTVIGEAATGEEAQRLCVELRPDVLLLDLSMPGPPAVDTAARVRRLSPGTRIVILTGCRDWAVGRTLLHQGVSGYVLKDDEPESVERAIRRVAAGDLWLSPQVVAELAANPASAAQPDLTTRQCDVLSRLSRGWSIARIAEDLGVREQTIRNYLRAIYEKLNVHSRTEAALWARDHGFGGPHDATPRH